MAWFPWRGERKERKEAGPLPSSAPQGSDQRHGVLSGLVSALKRTMSCLLFLCVCVGLLTVRHGNGWEENVIEVGGWIQVRAGVSEGAHSLLENLGDVASFLC